MNIENVFLLLNEIKLELIKINKKIDDLDEKIIKKDIRKRNQLIRKKIPFCFIAENKLEDKPCKQNKEPNIF